MTINIQIEKNFKKRIFFRLRLKFYPFQTVYIILKVWYNFTVKVFSAITTAAAALFAALGAAAYAETAETAYPADEDFTRTLSFTSLGDYAVNGDEYLFLDTADAGQQLVHYKEGEVTAYGSDETVTAVDCIDGVFCYSTASAVYTLDGGSSEVTPTGSVTTLTISPYIYYLYGGVLKITDYTNNTITTAEGSYSLLKEYGEKAYAVCDNVLYVFDGTAGTAVELSYTDYSVTENIGAGDTASALLNYTLAFADVKEGAYMTEVSLETVGDCFNADGSAETVKAAADTVALVLCYTGNAAIIAIDGQSYITLASALTERTFEYDAENGYEYATVTGSSIYASPFVASASAVYKNVSGEVVKILHRLTYEGVLDYVFYEVSYTSDGTTYTGYVAEGFLTEYIYAEDEEPTEVEEENYTESSDVKTVLLVLAAILLVLTAAGYLTFVATSRKKKDKNKDKNKDKKDGDDEEEED